MRWSPTCVWWVVVACSTTTVVPVVGGSDGLPPVCNTQLSCVGRQTGAARVEIDSNARDKGGD